MRQFHMHTANQLLEKKALVPVIALFCAMIWGLGYPLIKVGYTLFQIDADDTTAKFLFAGVRFSFAGLLIILFGSIQSRQLIRPLKKSISGICMLALFQTVFQAAFIYIGLAHTLSSKASVLNQIGVFLLVLITPLIYKSEIFTSRKALGLILGLVGVVVVNFNGGLDFSFTMAGEGFVVLSSLSTAIGYLLCKRMSIGERTFVLVGYQQLLGGTVLILVGYFGGGRLAPTGAAAWGLLLFLSISVAIVYVLWMLLLKHNNVSEVSIYKLGVPIAGVMASAILLGEHIFNFTNLIAITCVSIGIFLVNYRHNEKRRPAVLRIPSP